MISHSKKFTFKEGELYIKKFLVTKKGGGFSVVKKSNRNGSDLLAKRHGRWFAIEVKTTHKPKGKISDMHSTEFKKSGQAWFFVADYLYVLRLDGRDRPKTVDVLSQYEINEYSHAHRVLRRIRTSKLQGALSRGEIGKTIKI